MNSLQIKERNITSLKIKTIKNQIERNNETISRLSSQNKLSDFDKKQILERENKNTEYTKELEIQEKRLLELNNGSLNNELQEALKESTILAEENRKKNEDKIVKKIKEKKDKQIVDKTFIQKSYQNNRFISEKEMFYAYKNLSKFRTPAYIQRNLNDMPNNKGYILTDRDGLEIWCFGMLEEEPNKPLIMFKKLNDILYIYEIDKKYRTIYQKIGKNNKTLLSREERKNIH